MNEVEAHPTSSELDARNDDPVAAAPSGQLCSEPPGEGSAPVDNSAARSAGADCCPDAPDSAGVRAPTSL